MRELESLRQHFSQQPGFPPPANGPIWEIIDLSSCGSVNGADLVLSIRRTSTAQTGVWQQYLFTDETNAENSTGDALTLIIRVTKQAFSPRPLGRPAGSHRRSDHKTAAQKISGRPKKISVPQHPETHPNFFRGVSSSRLGIVPRSSLEGTGKGF